MKYALALLLACLIYVGYETIRIRSLYERSRELVASARPFSGGSGDRTILVLGDSTALGVGATDPTESVAGRIASYYGDTHVENYAISGAIIEQLPEQMDQAKHPHYDLILLQIGANDLIRFRSAENAGRALEPFVAAAAQRSDKVVFLSSGNVGATVFLPRVLNPYYTWMSQRYRDQFQKIADRTSTHYVTLFSKPSDDPFVREPARYLSVDGLHPSSEGYRLWFDRVLEYL